MTDHGLHPPSERGATGELQSIVRFRFHEGQLEEFKRLGAVPEDVRANLQGGPVQVFLPYRAL